MDVHDLEQRIHEKLSAFPIKTRRVAEYIVGKPAEVAFKSISDVADELSVSRAQLVRVARMLGFDGYSGLKNMLKQSLLEQISPGASAQKKIDGDAHIPEELRSLELANIEETFGALSSGDIVRFCETVKKSDTIYCMGWGISSLVSEWFYTRFTELGLKAVLVRRGSMSLLEQARGMGLCHRGGRGREQRGGARRMRSGDYGQPCRSDMRSCLFAFLRQRPLPHVRQQSYRADVRRSCPYVRARLQHGRKRPEGIGRSKRRP